MPNQVAEILKASYWTLIYQEQILALFSELAGFDPKTADDIRRAMGKKKLKVLEIYEPKFIKGCQEVGGLTSEYAESLWKDILGFADYCLAAGTKIMTPMQEKNISIEEIVKKQYKGTVLSYDPQVKIDPNQPQSTIQKVSQWHSRGIKPVYRYTLEDQSYIDCTKDHKFLTKSGKFLPIDLIYNKGKEIYSIYDQDS